MSEPIILVFHLTQGDMARFEAFETQTRVDRLEVHQKYFLLALFLGLPALAFTVMYNWRRTGKAWKHSSCE